MNSETTTLNYFHQVTSELGEKEEEGNLEVESAKKSEKNEHHYHPEMNRWFAQPRKMTYFLYSCWTVDLNVKE